MTQEALAEKAGIVPNYVSQVERGDKIPTVETLARMAAALEVTLSELFLGADRAPPRQLREVERALAGRTAGQQRRILEIVEAALRLLEEQ